MSYEQRPTETERREPVEFDDGTGLTKIIGLVLGALLIAAVLWILFGTGITPEGTGGGQGEVPPIDRPAEPGGVTVPRQPGAGPGAGSPGGSEGMAP